VLTATLPSTGHPIVAYSLPRDVFTGPLPSNPFPSTVCQALVGSCLPNRCLASGQMRHNNLRYEGSGPTSKETTQSAVQSMGLTLLPNRERFGAKGFGM
jgi:hypothetical protein